MTAEFNDFANDKSGLGAELRDARLARGLSLEDAQRATRIARRYLEALENEDFSVLPAPVFARGFLRSYAQFLGLDADTLLARFPGEPRPLAGLPDIHALGPRVALGPRRRARPRRTADADLYADDREFADDELTPIPTVDTRTPSVRLGPWLVAGFVLLVVLAGVVAVVTLGEDNPSAATTATTPPGVGERADTSITDTVAAAEQPTVRLETMPDLESRTLSDAIVVLRRAGLSFAIIEVFDPVAPAGVILDQVPAADAPLSSDSTVTVVVSRGPRSAAPSQDAAPTETATPETPSSEAAAPSDQPSLPVTEPQPQPPDAQPPEP